MGGVVGVPGLIGCRVLPCVEAVSCHLLGLGYEETSCRTVGGLGATACLLLCRAGPWDLWQQTMEVLKFVLGLW